MSTSSDMKAVIDVVAQKEQEIARRDKPQKLDLAGMPPNHTALYHSTGNRIDVFVPPVGHRSYRAADLADLARLINEFAGRTVSRGSDQNGAPSSIETPLVFVFVLNGTVHVILDEKGDRRDRLSLSFKPSDGWNELHTIDGEWQKQAAMVDALRTKINGRYSPEIVPLIRKIKFKSDSSGSSEVTTGRVSMGKSIEAAVSGLDGDFPDDVVVELPIYDEFIDENGNALRFGVSCSLDVNPADQTIRLACKAGQLAKALLDADTKMMQAIAAKVTCQNVKIFRGTPSA